MRPLRLVACSTVCAILIAALTCTVSGSAQAPASPPPGAASTTPDLQGPDIAPTRPVPVGKAPGMRVKLLKDTPEEQVYTVILSRGDEAISGLTDFALRYHVQDAHFTAIGAASSATLAWYDLTRKLYRRIPVAQQVEVLSMVGDIATLNDKPVVHTHVVLGRSDGTTVGGHTFELNINPTLEIFVTVNRTSLRKHPDPSGLSLIDPAL